PQLANSRRCLGATRLTGRLRRCTLLERHARIGAMDPMAPAKSVTSSSDFRDADLDALLELNALRAGGTSARLLQLETQFSGRFLPEHQLAVYGSLAPGRSNH